ncbi:GGDEF domain-containing protein [Catenovulum sp. 2E275]|uniref:GGDEF domain-containing protein n=1 Tax=Catenovulum sp. 2E275 TaxID=2980497 RepID=UPI0021D20350|nr:GGDEF domain-containing protein [Catenovulum sp. 2E275]MCU4675522.1 GGDEF domain-containing protein [Catenovulum sp. 2E275]
MNGLTVWLIPFCLTLLVISCSLAFIYKQPKLALHSVFVFIILSLNALFYAYTQLDSQAFSSVQLSLIEQFIAFSVYLSLLIQLVLLLMMLDAHLQAAVHAKPVWGVWLFSLLLVSGTTYFNADWYVYALNAGLVLAALSCFIFVVKQMSKLKLAALSGLISLLLALPNYFSAELNLSIAVYNGLVTLLSGFLFISICRAQFIAQLTENNNHQDRINLLMQQKFAIQNQLSAEHEAYQQLEVEMQARNFELEVTLRELQEKNNKLEQINTQDALTGVKNRRYFDERLFSEFRRSRREKAPLSLIMLDIDKFKSINDNYGHLVGDQVIRQTARLIQQQIRRVADCICRFGGEEFAIILPATDLQGAHIFAEKIRESLSNENIVTSDVTIRITASFGVATLYANDNNHPDELIRQADKALYQAKQLGRNRTVEAKPNIIRAIHPNQNLS